MISVLSVNATRKIIHVDMDAFYASVEVQGRPELWGLPVAVIATARKGAVMTANYEARTFGVKSAMPVHFAVQRCPQLVLIPARLDVYRAVSAQVHAVFAQFTDVIEPLALDEAYLDVTGKGHTLKDAIQMASEIKAGILANTQLTASAGVAHNKFLAKLASGMNKPNGLTVIAPEAVDALLAKLRVEDFHGVGPVTARKLRERGIQSGSDLRAQTRADLQALLGKLGGQLFDLTRGADERPVEAHREAKSVGVEHTFDADLTTREQLLAELPSIAAEVAARLRQRGYLGRTVTLKLRYEDWSLVTRRTTQQRALQDAGDLQRAAAKLLTSELLAGRGIRLLGVSVQSLSRTPDTPGQAVLLP